MAETDIFKYSTNERLSKMDVDLIDVATVADTEAHADGDVIVQSVEIPNAASVEGGSGIIQSIMLLDADDEAPAVDIVFSSNNTDLASGSGEPVNISDANAASLYGFVNVSNYTDLIGCQMATKTNIGMVFKASSGTRSIYMHIINRSGGTYTNAGSGDLKLRIGIVKD
tara:strand:+ start:355 stop:861 length:507 start_codon:yes stop_codon:yes gene_type:complete